MTTMADCAALDRRVLASVVARIYIPTLHGTSKVDTMQRKRENRRRRVVGTGEEGVRRSDWPIDRVVDVFPGQDEVVRMVKVRIFHGFLVQPVTKLVVIVLDKGTENCIGNAVPIRGGESAEEDELL
jgi:hypothetical protein